MFLASGLLIFRYLSLNNSKTAKPLNSTQQITKQPALIPEENPTIKIESSSKTKKSRNIRFTYRHSKAKKVDIIGSFNDWVPTLMAKGDDHLWAITLQLSPGEYSYNFVVDGKPIRDPNNKKVCNAGRGFINSYLKVLSLDEERAKSE